MISEWLLPAMSSYTSDVEVPAIADRATVQGGCRCIYPIRSTLPWLEEKSSTICQQFVGLLNQREPHFRPNSAFSEICTIFEVANRILRLLFEREFLIYSGKTHVFYLGD